MNTTPTMTPDARDECAAISDTLRAVSRQLADVTDRSDLARDRFGGEIAVVAGAVDTAVAALMRASRLAVTVPRGTANGDLEQLGQPDADGFRRVMFRERA